jgi:hypothetical protein
VLDVLRNLREGGIDNVDVRILRPYKELKLICDTIETMKKDKDNDYSETLRKQLLEIIELKPTLKRLWTTINSKLDK